VPEPSGLALAGLGLFALAWMSIRIRRKEVKPVGPRAPNLNAFIERWIQSLKHEALNHFIVFGLAHFDHIVSEFVDYYHDSRPHQGIGNRLIVAEDSDRPPQIESVVQLECETRLGGLLKTYRPPWKQRSSELYARERYQEVVWCQGVADFALLSVPLQPKVTVAKLALAG
jgi:Integrase core domain/PEP-CTERM motif